MDLILLALIHGALGIWLTLEIRAGRTSWETARREQAKRSSEVMSILEEDSARQSARTDAKFDAIVTVLMARVGIDYQNWKGNREGE